MSKSKNTATVPSDQFAFRCGLIIHADHQCDAILNKLHYETEFTLVVGINSKDISRRALCLLSLDPFTYAGEGLHFTHIGIINKGQRVATAQTRLKVTDVVKIPRISISTIVHYAPPKYKALIRRNFSNEYNNVPPSTGVELFSALIKAVPEVSVLLNSIAGKIYRPSTIRSKREADTAAEKDALGIALDIFGIERAKVLRSWQVSDGDGSVGKSFLEGISEYSAYEDDLIQHDLNTLPGWDVLNKDITGIVEFKNEDNERLVVINANRKPLEKALGIDLIYFHRKYESFVFIQYKMMDQKDNEKRNYYNPNQESHQKEQVRMERLYDLIRKEAPGETLNDYRLGECPIFFKVCKKLQFVAEETSIAAGAYIPLNQWPVLVADSSTKGPSGGCQIGFHTLGKRYLGTQVFVDLVQRGFIGTQAKASAKIGLFIEDAIKNGHSVIYAIDESKKVK